MPWVSHRWSRPSLPLLDFPEKHPVRIRVGYRDVLHRGAQSLRKKVALGNPRTTVKELKEAICVLQSNRCFYRLQRQSKDLRK